MPEPTFTAPPSAPSRSDAPATFITRANAFLAWMATFAGELITGVSWFSEQVASAAGDAASATSSAAAATAAAAAAVNAPGTTGSSSTSLTISAGAQSFTMTTGKTLVAGQALSLASAADPANRMVVVLSSYDSGSGAATGTALAGQLSGSGTYDDWVIGMAALANIAGRHAIWVPAGAMTARVTNGPAGGLMETATSKVMARSYDFDASTIEYAQFAIQMPKSWDEGTITFAPVWSHGATTTNFKASWGLQAMALANDDALDTAFGTAQFSNDTGGTTGDLYIGPESAAITVAGSPGAEEVVYFQVLRKADDGTNDTLAVDARLIGVTVWINTAAENDA